MNRCSWSRCVIDSFAAHDTPELPDALALHLDDCADCRDYFDAAFTPVAFVSAPLRATVRTGPRWALAAAALFALLPLMRTAEVPSPGITEWPESELPVVADLPDECELEHEPLEVCEA